MSDVVTGNRDRAGGWEPVPRPDRFSGAAVTGGCLRSIAAVDATSYPTVEPGQLWHVELPSTQPALSALEHRALTTANVVIFDRALGAQVAQFLPLSGYAEPAAPGEGPSDPAMERCLRFVREGWSVARLVEPGSGRGGIIGRLCERLLRVGRPGAAPVSIFANASGRYNRCEVELGELSDVMECAPFRLAAALTIVVGAISATGSPGLPVASTNGLAG